MAKVASRASARKILASLAEQETVRKFPGWSPRIGIILDESPWVVCQLRESGLHIEDWESDGLKPETIIAMTYEGLDGWLVRFVDFTHLVKAGEITVVGGTYFDLLLLSKVLRLRPENSRGVST